MCISRYEPPAPRHPQQHQAHDASTFTHHFRVRLFLTFLASFDIRSLARRANPLNEGNEDDQTTSRQTFTTRIPSYLFCRRNFVTTTIQLYPLFDQFVDPAIAVLLPSTQMCKLSCGKCWPFFVVMH